MSYVEDHLSVVTERDKHLCSGCCCGGATITYTDCDADDQLECHALCCLVEHYFCRVLLPCCCNCLTKQQVVKTVKYSFKIGGCPEDILVFLR